MGKNAQKTGGADKFRKIFTGEPVQFQFGRPKNNGSGPRVIGGSPGQVTGPMTPGQTTSPTPGIPKPVSSPTAPQPESSAVMPSPSVNNPLNKLPKAQKLPYGFNNPRKLY